MKPKVHEHQKNNFYRVSKTLKLIPLLAMLFMLNVASTCRHDDHHDDDDHQRGKDHAVVARIATQGSWQVGFLENSGKDETALFSGYSFAFSKDGSLKAINGNDALNGNWLVADYDNGLALSFAAVDFRELSGQWQIISHNDNKIELISTNAKGETDLLTFIKTNL